LFDCAEQFKVLSSSSKVINMFVCCSLILQSYFCSVSLRWLRSSKKEEYCHLARVEWSWHKLREMGTSLWLLFVCHSCRRSFQGWKYMEEPKSPGSDFG